MTKYKAINWNRPDDSFTETFWNQNIMQLWFPEEIPVSDDKQVWTTLSIAEQEVYKRVLGGLTLLDTLQGGAGMPKILEHVDGLQRKAVLGFMGMMEQVHAKSYSNIFTTLITKEETDEIFKWVEDNKYLQKKAKIIDSYYQNIRTKRDLFMAMAASVMLESYLFYSGFYYPLYLSGQGKLTNSGDIIELIMQDEAIHGLYVGTIAQELFQALNKRTQTSIKNEIYDLMNELYENEALYTDELYSPIGIQEDVKKYIRYNANRSLMNLGLETLYPDEDINPIVFNAVNSKTKQHDFFSKKGSSYARATNIVPLKDEDFDMSTYT